MKTQQPRFEIFRATILALSLAGLAMVACGGNEPTERRPITASFEVNKPRAPIGSPIEITYSFDIAADSEPISKDYTVFVHFLDSHNAQLFTDDHQPEIPTSEWKAGSKVEYMRTFFIPLYPYLGTATVELGLYLPGEGGSRLGLDGADSGRLSYRAGQLELLDQKENIFLVYKEGWHQLESAPENPNLEWQWTKKEAVCSFRNPKKESVLYLEADANVEAFEEPLNVSVLIGETEIAAFGVTGRDPFLQKLTIPADALGEEDWVGLGRPPNREQYFVHPVGCGRGRRHA